MKILSQKNYGTAIHPLKNVTINNLFARSVIEKHVLGTVYVDNLEKPKVFYVVHPYGMALFYGETDDSVFLRNFRAHMFNQHKSRQKEEWLQVFPSEWETKIDNMLGDDVINGEDNEKQQYTARTKKNNNVVKYTRVNFTFNREKYEVFKKENITEQYTIIKTDNRLFSEMNGSVVPKNFWNNEKDFAEKGIGFSIIYEGKLITTAFSAFIHDNLLELGMETIPEYRKKGFAKYACAKLIDYCIENEYEPVWACRADNYGSYYLAQKLGFEPVKYLPYYKLEI